MLENEVQIYMLFREYQERSFVTFLFFGRKIDREMAVLESVAYEKQISMIGLKRM